MEKIEITSEQFKKMQDLLEKEEKAKIYARRQAVKNQIILEKAKKHGITASKKEIDDKIAMLDAGTGDNVEENAGEKEV